METEVQRLRSEVQDLRHANRLGISPEAGGPDRLSLGSDAPDGT